ncbi:MAG: hypothetical protein AAF621_02910 [Pseudomonadota bacterium]
MADDSTGKVSGDGTGGPSTKKTKIQSLLKSLKSKIKGRGKVNPSAGGGGGGGGSAASAQNDKPVAAKDRVIVGEEVLTNMKSKLDGMTFGKVVQKIKSADPKEKSKVVERLKAMKPK